MWPSSHENFSVPVVQTCSYLLYFFARAGARIWFKVGRIPRSSRTLIDKKLTCLGWDTTGLSRSYYQMCNDTIDINVGNVGQHIGTAHIDDVPIFEEYIMVATLMLWIIIQYVALARRCITKIENNVMVIWVREGYDNSESEPFWQPGISVDIQRSQDIWHLYRNLFYK